MNYNDIDSILAQHGLAGDPAFDGMHVLITPIISDDNPAPLGLYYPGEDKQQVVLPPEADISTALHEFGHRYGAYHYGDLSEEFAENFRHKMESGITGPIALARMPNNIDRRHRMLEQPISDDTLDIVADGDDFNDDGSLNPLDKTTPTRNPNIIRVGCI